jgi:hypothetical protein
MHMKIKSAVLVACVLVSAVVTAFPVFGHHSFSAQYDASKALRVRGVLAKIEWGNPHIYFYLDVKDDAGNVVRWACEGGAPAALTRRGFNRGDMKLGDTIIVDGYQSRNGARMMDARRVTLANGRIVAGAGADDGGPNPGVPAQ